MGRESALCEPIILMAKPFAFRSSADEMGLDTSGQVVVRKRCSRTQLLAYAPNLLVQLIGMEPAVESTFWGRALREQGHEVRLMPAQHAVPVW